MNIINFIVEHWSVGFQIFGLLVAAATVYVKATPNVKDDSILATIQKVADWLSIVNPKALKV